MHASPRLRLAAASSLAALAALALAACGDTRAARLGAEGESCFQDADCRDELICEARACAPLGASANNSPGNNNPGNNNPGNNNPTPGDYLSQGCADLCEYFGACGVDLDESCPLDCADGLEGTAQDDFNRFLDCSFAVSCDELLQGGLERCFNELPIGQNNGSPPPVPDDRYESCDFLFAAAVQLCDDDTGTKLYEDCVFYAAPNLGDRPFYQGINCANNTGRCDALVECISDAWY